MALTSNISNAEIAGGAPVVGDVDPASTQAGTITRLRDADDEIAADLADLKDIWDGHDHDPANPTGAGGLPIGTGGVRAIADDQITTALIDSGAITGGKTAAGAIGTSHIPDESVPKAKLGSAQEHFLTIPAAGGSATWTHNKGYVPVQCAMCDDDEWVGPFGFARYGMVQMGPNSTTVSHVGAGHDLQVTILYLG